MSNGGDHRSTNLSVKLEPSVRGEHHDSWRAEGVLGGQQYAEVVQPALELRARRSPDRTVPFLQAGQSATDGTRPRMRSYSRRYRPASAGT